MGRIAGRNGRIYFDVAGGGSASPLPFVAKWSYKANTDKFEVTAMGDTAKSYVAGLPDSSGDWSGWYDTSTSQSYAAAVDGIARKLYIYPDLVGAPTVYWYGTVFADISIDSDVNGATAMQASWNAATAMQKSTA